MLDMVFKTIDENTTSYQNILKLKYHSTYGCGVVCMHECTYMCMYVCVYVCLYVCVTLTCSSSSFDVNHFPYTWALFTLVLARGFFPMLPHT